MDWFLYDRDQRHERVIQDVTSKITISSEETNKALHPKYSMLYYLLNLGLFIALLHVVL